MIEVKELRIGNWVIWNEDETYMRIGASSFLLPDNRFNPVPLTPEILGKAGFRVNLMGGKNGVHEYRYAKHQDVPLLNGSIWDDGTMNFMNMDAPCKYLHQLQNLYFSLTGEELMIEDLNVQRSVASKAK